VPMAGKAGETRIPLTLQRSRLKAEKKTLDFEFEVVSVQFNRLGRYALRLTVENPLLQDSGSGIQLRINNGEVIQSSTVTTDTIEQSYLNQIYCFQRRKFTFTLPRAGFCKNDKNHDVRLHIEALHFPGRAQRIRRNKRVGEAFFAIYPRTNQPRMKLSAGRDEDWYRYSAVMPLLRVGSEQPAMHCGRLAFAASLHEHRPPTTLVSPSLLSPSTCEEDRRAAGTATASPALGIPVPSRSFHTPESAYHSLPTEGRACSPEVREPKSGGIGDLPAASATPPALPAPPLQAGAGRYSSCHSILLLIPAYNSDCHPCWSWGLWVKGALCNGVIPVGNLDLASQGRCSKKLVSKQRAAQASCEVGTREALYWAFFFHLQWGKHGGKGMGLQAGKYFFPQHPVEGDARLGWVSEGSLNRCCCALINVGGCPAPERSNFPSPSVKVSPCQHFNSPRVLADGSLCAETWQTSLILPPNQPPLCSGWQKFLFPAQQLGIWNPLLIFLGRGCSFLPSPCFSPSSFSSCPVTANLLSHLLQLSTFPALPSPLAPALPSVTLKSLLSAMENSPAKNLSVVCGFFPVRSSWSRVPLHSLLHRSQDVTGDEQEPVSTRDIEGDTGKKSIVGNYHLALKRMAGDILSLRQHVTSLEVENGHLRRSLASQEELGHALLADEAAWTLAATFKRELVANTREMKRLKDRVQQLQNELIRKNDREKDLVLLQRAHQHQQATLRRCQEKAAKAKVLEETVKQQEKVIKVMERVLQEKLARAGRSTGKVAGGVGRIPVAPPPHPTGEVLSGEVYAVLLAENQRLREELARPPRPSSPIIPQPPALPGVFRGAEKLSLLARLEEAQARGRVLERQLKEAARRWGREKQELGTRLLEQEHGF
ncbi:CCD33 protein, partial [Piaya cayana]|nr:CCD33 protein [Piaya cayana]